MAATDIYYKFDCFTFDVLASKHDFEVDTFKLMLTNTAPVAADSVRADINEIAAGNGYSAGGVIVTVSGVTASGVAKIIGSQSILTALGGPIGPFRYVVLYNDTSPTKPLVSWWDYGSELTLVDTDILTFKPDPANGIFQMS